MNTLYLNNTELELMEKAIAYYITNKQITKYTDDTLVIILNKLQDSKHNIEIHLPLHQLELLMSTLTYYKENYQEC